MPTKSMRTLFRSQKTLNTLKLRLDLRSLAIHKFIPTYMVHLYVTSIEAKSIWLPTVTLHKDLGSCSQIYNPPWHGELSANYDHKIVVQVFSLLNS